MKCTKKQKRTCAVARPPFLAVESITHRDFHWLVFGILENGQFYRRKQVKYGKLSFSFFKRADQMEICFLFFALKSMVHSNLPA